VPPSLALLSLLTACSGGGGSAFELTVTPVVADNQLDLLSGLDRLVLVITPEGGAPVELEVSALQSGQTTSFEGVAGADAAVLELRGFIGSDVVAIGESETVSFGEGPQDVEIFVAAVDELAELTALSSARAFAAVAPGGDGRFLLFGGSPEGGKLGDRDNAIFSLDLAPPDAGLSFQQLDVTMPALEDGVAGRICHTATPLTQGSHGLLGRILVVGGAAGILDSEGVPPATFADASTVTADAFLFDPATDTVTDLSESARLNRNRCLHTAHELPSGQVIVVGGIGDIDGTWAFEQSAEIFDPDHGSFDLASGTPSGPMLFHAAARLGDDRVLACFGLQSAANGLVKGSTDCDIIASSGEITTVDMSGWDLPLVHAAMAPLPDGRVLLTGGFDTTDITDSIFGFDGVPAVADAWIFDGSTWGPADSMAVPRAMHRMVPLPNGDVLVVGGVTEVDGTRGMIYSSDAAVACAEVYDSNSGRFRILGDCDTGAGLGSMSQAAAMPAAGLDVDRGVMVVGGLGRDGGSTSNVDFYAPVP